MNKRVATGANNPLGSRNFNNIKSAAGYKSALG